MWVALILVTMKKTAENGSAENGSRKIVIRTVDNDVVVLAVASFHYLTLEERHVDTLRHGLKMQLIQTHELSQALGPAKCLALPVFHCITVCGATSSFGGKRKKTTWKTWNVNTVDIDNVIDNIFGKDQDFQC